MKHDQVFRHPGGRDMRCRHWDLCCLTGLIGWVVLCIGLAAPAYAKSGPVPHEAKIASYAIEVEAKDPPGTRRELGLAARLAARSPKCAEVALAAYVPPSQRQSGEHNKPYFVQCMTREGLKSGFGGYGVYFNAAELGAGAVEGPKRPIPKMKALLLCRRAILARLRYPSSARFSLLSEYVSDTRTVNREVMLNFTALNGLGHRIPQRGKCYVQPDGHTDVISLVDR